MATVYFTEADIAAGETITKPFNTGSLCAIKVFNMSPYTLVINDSASYDHTTYYDTMLDMIQPWTIQPIATSEYPVKCWITMDTEFSPKNTTDPNLLSLQGVTIRSYQNQLANYNGISLLQNTDTNISNPTISTDANITNTTAIPTDANITNSSISTDANITNTSVPVSGSVDANITNTVAIPTDANITNSSINVDANITNTTVNVATAVCSILDALFPNTFAGRFVGCPE